MIATSLMGGVLDFPNDRGAGAPTRPSDPSSGAGIGGNAGAEEEPIGDSSQNEVDDHQ
jgi:hypothetical protein